ncbi:cytochrome P450 [Auricularia subglabra TFB-10046 SS5]|nr:cytochrome P450 [Auricularia subglabra TFB-10046 SS5]
MLVTLGFHVHNLASRVAFDLVFAFVAVWLLRTVYRLTRFRTALSHIPGPEPTSLLWGNDWDVYVSAPGKLFKDWARIYGGAVRSHGAFGAQMVSFTDPRAVQHIFDMHEYYHYPKPEGVRAFFELLLGKGVIWAEGPSHTEQRRALAPAFSQQALRDLTPIFFDSANKAAGRWAELIDQSPKEHAEIDIQFWANRMSLDSIGLAGFSYDFETLTSKALAPLAAALDALTDSSGFVTSFSAYAVHAFMMTVPAVLRIPGKRTDKMRATRDMLGEITGSMWRDAEKAGDGAGGKTILDILMRADRARDVEHHMSEEQIAAEMMTLIFAGYETTSCVISWALYELARNPRVQAELRAELTARPTEPDFEQLQRGLPLLDAVVDEVLRLHPPVLDPHRVAAQDDTVPLSTGERVFVPKGTIINVPVNVVQTDPRVWGPDADEFKPARWLDPARTKEQRQLMVFGSGPRMCIGRHFAELEVKATLATFIRQFAFAPVPTKDIEPFVSFVVRPRVHGDTKSTLPLLVSRGREHQLQHLQDDILTAVRAFETRLTSVVGELSLEQTLLPIETLQLIFQHCQRNSNDGAPTWNTRLQPIIGLSRVCWHWRSAALGDPKLWTVVSATDYKELEALLEVLPRSKALPVDLSIEWRMYSPDSLRSSVMGALSTHLHHFRSLQINIRDEHSNPWLQCLTFPAPLLETFDLVRGARSPEPVGDAISIAHSLFGGRAPGLHHVSFENVPLDVLDADVFRGVTTLSVSQVSISPQDARAVLASCPLVEDLTLSGTQSAFLLPRPPQARHGGTWPCAALARLSLTDVDTRSVDLIVPHLPLGHLELLDIAQTPLSSGIMADLSRDTVAALIDDAPPKSIALRGTLPDAREYPPSAPLWDVIVTTARGATRAFPIAQMHAHPRLLEACRGAATLSVSSHIWPVLADLCAGAAFQAHRLTIALEDRAAAAAVCSMRPLMFSKLKRLVLSAPDVPGGLVADACRITNRAIVLSLLRGSLLRKLVLKNVRHDGRLDEMLTVAERYEVVNA